MTSPRIGVVASRWHQPITDELLAGAEGILSEAGAEVQIIRVPGAWEIPVAVRALVAKGDIHGVVALGCVMQGDTAHAEHLVSQVGSALMGLQVESGLPLAWGVIAARDEEQAWERAGGSVGHRGKEAASAVLETIAALQALR